LIVISTNNGKVFHKNGYLTQYQVDIWFTSFGAVFDETVLLNCQEVVLIQFLWPFRWSNIKIQKTSLGEI